MNQFLLPAILMIAAVASPISPARSHPDSCITHDTPIHGHKAEGLKRGAPGVLHDVVKFAYDERDYLIETFSSTDRMPDRRARQCFRYELLNPGTESVSYVGWPVAGISTKSLKPGEDGRRSMSNDYDVLYDPVPDDTEIYAFENTPGTSEAWNDVAEAVRENGSVVSEFFREFFAGNAQAAADFAWNLEENATPAVVSADAGSVGEEVLAVSTTYSMPLANVTYQSELSRNADNFITQSHALSGEGEDFIKARFPDLTAIPTDQPLGDTDLQSLHKILVETAGASHDLKESAVSRSASLSAGETFQEQVFLIDLPVVIETSEDADCILVKAFSFMPLVYDLAWCREMM